MRPLAFALILSAASQAQFTVQQSNSTASLRGIANVDGAVAWASGTAGTVLKTLDGGAHWQTCAVPTGADALDFRGIQAFDAKSALVMSIGKGDASRVYRTDDGCKTWSLVFTNPDTPDGFFDSIYFTKRNEGWLLGDPVKGRFYLAATHDGGRSWKQVVSPGLVASGEGGAFAASNQSVVFAPGGPVFGGGSGLLFRGMWERCPDSTQYNDPESCTLHIQFQRSMLPVGAMTASSGIFALSRTTTAMVAVGGDYTHPTDAAKIAAYSTDDGLTWAAAETQPRGYRSSVAYDADAETWITTGPTGTDTSRDDGRTWQPVVPSAKDAPDADRNWNALSLPFVVGPKGRIGKLRPDALTKR